MGEGILDLLAKIPGLTVIGRTSSFQFKGKNGLGILRRHLGKLASGSTGLVATPNLSELLGRDLGALRGKGLKCYEDTLDALFCAYLAWHCWGWGAKRNK